MNGLINKPNELDEKIFDMKYLTTDKEDFMQLHYNEEIRINNDKLIRQAFEKCNWLVPVMVTLGYKSNQAYLNYLKKRDVNRYNELKLELETSDKPHSYLIGEDAKKHIDVLMRRAIRRNTKMFKYMVIHIRKVEFGEGKGNENGSKGLHYHILFLFNGGAGKVKNGYSKAKAIGEYWEKITDGMGHSYNHHLGAEGRGLYDFYLTKIHINNNDMVEKLIRGSWYLAKMCNSDNRVAEYLGHNRNYDRSNFFNDKEYPITKIYSPHTLIYALEIPKDKRTNPKYIQVNHFKQPISYQSVIKSVELIKRKHKLNHGVYPASILIIEPNVCKLINYIGFRPRELIKHGFDMSGWYNANPIYPYDPMTLKEYTKKEIKEKQQAYWSDPQLPINKQELGNPIKHKHKPKPKKIKRWMLKNKISTY